MKTLNYVIYPILSLLLSLKSGNSISSAINSLQEKGKITVVTRISNNTISHKNNEELNGPEFDLINKFSQFVKTPVDLVVIKEHLSLEEIMKNYDADIVVLGANVTSDIPSLAEIPHSKSRESLVCNKTLRKDSPFVVTIDSKLAFLTTEIETKFPKASVLTLNSKSPEDFMKFISEKNADCTVVPKNIALTNKRFFNNLSIVYTTSQKVNISWFVKRDEYGMGNLVQHWFRSIKDSGLYAQIKERHYGHLSSSSGFESRILHSRYKTRLPYYIPMFKQAEKKSGISWKLLSAISYQESHWNPRAESFTGVRGMMMLTQSTARTLGVKDRNNALDSILGGAKYLNQIKDLLPLNIQEPDRTWMALAAYNVGLGHLEDAMDLCKKLGKNYTSWKDMQTILPLLSVKSYYKTLKFGKARGLEPVQYVQRIRNYFDQIAHLDSKPGSVEFRIPLYAANN